MKIKLVAIDLDDTLLDGGLKISPRCVRAISKARDKGVLVTLATGRMFRSALPYAMQLEMDVPLITYQGALVQSSISREVFYFKPLPHETAGALVDYFKQERVHCHSYIDDRLCVESFTPEGRFYEQLAGVQAVRVDDLAAAVRTSDALKIMAIIEDEERLLSMQRHLQGKYGRSLHITRSKPFFLEAMDREANKGLALQVTADYFGINRGEVLAIGDSYNDLDMIQWAGTGVAMGNARPEVKAAADYVTASNEEEGVAEALERYILN